MPAVRSLFTLALFVEKELGIAASAPISTDQNFLLIRHNAIAPVIPGDLDLIPPDDLFVLKKFYYRAVGKRISQIDIYSVQKMKIVKMQSGDRERIDLIDQLSPASFQRLYASLPHTFRRHTATAEWMRVRQDTACADILFLAYRTTIGPAIILHLLLNL